MITSRSVTVIPVQFFLGLPYYVPSLFRHPHHEATNHNLPLVPPVAELKSPEHMAEARAWVEKFKAVSALKGAAGVEMTFSRSSGPGGQNVNKVNTKATLRCPTNAPWIPGWARAELAKNPHYVASTQSILLTSTVHRSQSQNVEECFTKLHSLILDASSAPIKKATSPEQKKKVEALMKADAVRRRAEKNHRSNVKKGRKGGDWF